MTVIRAERHAEIPQTYRVARAAGLFNVDLSQGRDFSIEATIPIGRGDEGYDAWRIGVVVGPSGSGKSTIAEELRHEFYEDWDQVEWSNEPIIDAIGGSSFEDATAALASVGLGSVPSWLRPYSVLSNGERFRAGLARLLMLPDVWSCTVDHRTQPCGECGGCKEAAQNAPRVFVDEFTSVVDRRVAQIGSQAFAKAWRRRRYGKVVLLTPHFDILPWLQPDWVCRTSLTGPTVTLRDVDHVVQEVERPADAPVVATIVS